MDNLNLITLPLKLRERFECKFYGRMRASTMAPMVLEGTLEEFIRRSGDAVYNRLLDAHVAFYRQVVRDYAKDGIVYSAPSREELDIRLWSSRNTRFIMLDYSHLVDYDQNKPAICFITYSLDTEYKNTVMVESLYVAKQVRRCGIGNFLLDTCITLCQERLPDKNMKLLIGVGEYNTGAFALYQRKGFTKRTFSYFERQLNP